MDPLKNVFMEMQKIASEGLRKYYPSCGICLGNFENFYVDYMGCEFGSFFDVASITKPIVGSNLILKLGILEDRISSVLNKPRFDSTSKSDIKVLDILRHKACFPSHFPLFSIVEHIGYPSVETRKIIMEEAWNLPLEKKSEYSDIGFIVLTYYLEKMSGVRVDILFKQNFSFNGLFYLTESDDKINIVPTYYTRRVHDENAYYMLSVSLHAGLFCNLEGLAEAMRYIIQSYRELFLKEGINEIKKGERFYLGFDSFIWNQKILFGHLGFTGCGFWIDFSRELYCAFLSNRVFPSVGRIPVPAPEGFMNIRKSIWHMLCDKSC